MGGISTYMAKRIISWQLTNDDLEEFEYRSDDGTSAIRVDPEVYDRVIASYRAVPDLVRNGSSAIREIAGTEALSRDCVSAILADAAALVAS